VGHPSHPGKNGTSEDHVAEPLGSQVNTSGLSSESRAPGLSFQRPSSYILRCQKREEGDLEDTSEQHGAKRLLSDENGSSLEDEAPGQHGADVRPPSVFDSDDNDEFIPWSKGPDPRGRNGNSSDDDYKEDPVDLWALRQRQLGNKKPRGGPWPWSPGGGGREQDERHSSGICDAMQDEVLTPASSRKTELFDWGSPAPDILQEIEDHARRQRNIERCPAPLPWSPDGDGRKSERPSWLPAHPDEQLKKCPMCQTWAYGSRCCTLSSKTSSTGSSTGSSYMSRFR
jgi:hypothetical protein